MHALLKNMLKEGILRVGISAQTKFQMCTFERDPRCEMKQVFCGTLSEKTRTCTYM